MTFPRVTLEKRTSTSLLVVCSLPPMAVLATLVVSIIPLRFLGINPLHAYKLFLDGMVGSFYGISEVMVRAIPLTLAGLAVALPLRAGFFNIGAEGQLLIGALVGGAVVLALPEFPRPFLLPLMIVAGFVGGGVWGLIPGLLKAKLRVNEILTSLMMTYAGLMLYTYFVFGPLRELGLGFPQSSPIPEAARLTRLFGTRLHTGLFMAVVAGLLIYLLVKKTRIGCDLAFTGANPTAATACGINQAKAILFATFIAGGLAGLAGVSELAGVQMRLREGLSPGFGFTGIMVAILAKGHPIGVFFSALFFAGIAIGGLHMQLMTGIPMPMVEALQVLVVLFFVAGDLLNSYSVHFKRVPKGQDMPSFTAQRSTGGQQDASTSN